MGKEKNTPPTPLKFRGGKFLRTAISVKTEIQKALKILDSSLRWNDILIYFMLIYENFPPPNPLKRGVYGDLPFWELSGIGFLVRRCEY